MKKIILLAALVFTTTLAAQAQETVLTKEQRTAQKKFKSAQKAYDKAEKKLFDARRKMIELGLEATKSVNLKKPVLVTPADSAAYYFGVAQSNGLDQYVMKNLHVDSLYLNRFADALEKRINADTRDPEVVARQAGVHVAGQIELMTESASREYFSDEGATQLDKRLICAGILAGFYGTSDVNPMGAHQIYSRLKANQQAADKERLYGRNRTEGETYLAANKLKKGVITLPSGLQYKVITEGKGAIPTETQTVKVHYEGRLIDGTVFDSSYKRGEPTKFRCNQVIKGWTEALTKMPVGSKWELYIPQELAYGANGAGSNIPPYSVLVFTVELIDIEK